FDRSMERYEAAATKTMTSLSIMNAGQAFIFSVGLTLLMAMAARGIARGELTAGDFVMVNALLIQLYQPLNFLGSVYRDIKQGLIDIETMFALLEVPPEIVDSPDARPLRVVQGAIEFDAVSFAYDPDRQILSDVSFTVEPGHTIAIVGPSGAGKSTLSRLLVRVYDATSGAIRIDGQHMTEGAQESRRRAIGFDPAETVLINDTVLYNIRHGRPDATDEDAIEAAKLAQIHDFIESLPRGYQTLVGERGLKLSGGEKQR